MLALWGPDISIARLNSPFQSAIAQFQLLLQRVLEVLLSTRTLILVRMIAYLAQRARMWNS